MIQALRRKGIGVKRHNYFYWHSRSFLLHESSPFYIDLVPVNFKPFASLLHGGVFDLEGKVLDFSRRCNVLLLLL